MGKIAFVRGADTLHNDVFEQLQRNLLPHTISAYDFSPLDAAVIKSNQPDLLIVDTNLEANMNDLLEFRWPITTKIAVWISQLENDFLIELFKRGLNGYLYHGMEPSELIFAIKSILHGRQYIHSLLSSILLNNFIRLTESSTKRPTDLLTNREWEILEKIVEGNNNRDIAKNLCISNDTVKNHVNSIFKKLHVTDRTKAAILAVKNKWISL